MDKYEKPTDYDIRRRIDSIATTWTAYEVGHHDGWEDARALRDRENMRAGAARFDALMRRAVGLLSDIQKQDSEIASILNDYSKVTARQATPEIGPTPRIERCPTHRWNTGKVDRCLLVNGHGGEHRWPA